MEFRLFSENASLRNLHWRPRAPRVDCALSLPDGPFPLSQGALSTELFHEGDDERAGECVYPGDFADWKPRADVLLRGALHAPRGAGAGEIRARFAVGGWSKELRFRADRPAPAGFGPISPEAPWRS